jgi:DNA invertase Pin-like site-specific DNA recombinase
MRYVAYLRVSTDEQAESGAGLAAQLDACRQHAERGGGADLIGPFADEGISGAAGIDKRPALLEALAALSPGDVLLVAKRDRLGRDPIAVAMIEAAVRRKGARVVSAAGEGTDGDGPTDVLMRRIVDAFAEYERLLIAARTRAAMQAKARRGERCGTIRFGFDLAADGTNLIANDAEQRAVGIIREMRAAGYSLRSTAVALNAQGIPTKNSRRPWVHTSVKSVLSRLNVTPTTEN